MGLLKHNCFVRITGTDIERNTTEALDLDVESYLVFVISSYPDNPHQIPRDRKIDSLHCFEIDFL